ncbi:MAG: hypothetical protein Q4D76_00775 [Oscillospiraceae bacterium]|nr:hypothetical protein [Oscillospiraceae bacterium]
MKNGMKLLKSHWITAWLILLIISAVTFVSYAEYIENQNRMKRVAANIADSGRLFTSDYLSAGTPTPREVQFASNVTSCMIPVKIRNYNTADASTFYTRGLPYDVVFQLVKSDGSLVTSENLGGYRVSVRKSTEENYIDFSETESTKDVEVTESNGFQYTYTVTSRYSAENGYTIAYKNMKFDNRGRFEHLFQLDFQKEIMTNDADIYIKMTAAPDEGIRDELDVLSGILGVTNVQPTLTQGWKGSFTDAMANTDYDGFNYVISGSGEDIIRFSWNADKLEVNAFFLTEIQSDLVSGYTTPVSEEREGITWKTIYIHVNSSDTFGTTIVDGVEKIELKRSGISHYDIQLFMKGDAVSDYSDWTAIKSYVEFEAKAKVPTA